MKKEYEEIWKTANNDVKEVFPDIDNKFKDLVNSKKFESDKDLMLYITALRQLMEVKLSIAMIKYELEFNIKNNKN